ncbi:hypothetical protein ES705_19565 [subsurface metagenome]
MEILPNHAEVILRGENLQGDSFVLARTGQSFATWAIDQDRNAFWGHYYSFTLDGLIDAAPDFKRRTGHPHPVTPLKGVKQL